jgi:serine/threonine protein kinase
MPSIVSEFVEGGTLREVVNSNKLPLSQILDIAIQLSSALAAAHTAGIVYRDIKPENIILRPDGLVKILDSEWQTSFSREPSAPTTRRWIKRRRSC